MRHLIRNAGTAISLMAVLLLSPSVKAVKAQDSELQKFTRSNVLGTSFEMGVKSSIDEAKQAQAAALAEIDRLASVFSTYEPSSEVSELNQNGVTNAPSKDLVALIRLCEKWQKSLPKSFSCRLGNVIAMWQSFEQQQQRPNRVDIRKTARAAQQSNFSVDDLKAGIANQDFTWDFGGIAKGYILDKAMEVAKMSAPNANAIKIDIGGDGVYWSSLSDNRQQWQVGLAVPHSIDDGQAIRLGILNINRGAIAYSGHSSRSRTIARRAYSHILAPRDGWPKHSPITAIVKAPDATSADALATALAVSDISVALDWLEKNPRYAALLIDSDGRQYASNNWYQNYQAQHTDEQTNKGYQAKISFTLPKIDVVKYRKPYVSLWIADKKGKVVKNLLILGQSERWMQENRSWWRTQGRKTPQLLDGFARPTRRPGHYEVIWNGRDDFGQSLPEGEYRLFAEASREHGDYEKISLPFNLMNQKQALTKNGKKEIDALTITFN